MKKYNQTEKESNIVFLKIKQTMKVLSKNRIIGK